MSFRPIRNSGQSGYHEINCKSNLIEFDDVGMTKQFQILNFPPNLSDDVQRLDFLPVQNFDRHLVLRDLVKADCEKDKTVDDDDDDGLQFYKTGFNHRKQIY